MKAFQDPALRRLLRKLHRIQRDVQWSLREPYCTEERELTAFLSRLDQVVQFFKDVQAGRRTLEPIPEE
jgi:hypothetical protein